MQSLSPEHCSPLTGHLEEFSLRDEARDVVQSHTVFDDPLQLGPGHIKKHQGVAKRHHIHHVLESDRSAGALRRRNFDFILSQENDCKNTEKERVVAVRHWLRTLIVKVKGTSENR